MDFFKQFKLSICLTPTPLALALGLICSATPPLTALAQTQNSAPELSRVDVTARRMGQTPRPVINPT